MPTGTRCASCWAPVDEKTYGNPFFWGIQITAGSRTCLGYFELLRIAGAQARYVLLETAARKWQVAGHTSSRRARVSYRTHRASAVSHTPSSSRMRSCPTSSPTFCRLMANRRRSTTSSASRRHCGCHRAPRGPPRCISSRCATSSCSVSMRRASIFPTRSAARRAIGIDFEVPEMVLALVATGPGSGRCPPGSTNGRARDARRARRDPLPYGVAVVANDIDVAA